MIELTQTPEVDALESTSKKEFVYQHIPSVGWRYVLSQIRTSIPLVLSDATAAFASSLMVFLIFGPLFNWSIGFAAGFVASAIVVSNFVIGLYPAIGIHPAIEMKRCMLVSGAICGCLLLATIHGLMGAAEFTLVAILKYGGSLVLIWLLTSVSITTCRSLFRMYLSRFDWWAQPVLFVGTGRQTEQLMANLEKHRQCGLRPFGFVGGSQQQWNDDSLEMKKYLGDTSEISGIQKRDCIGWAVIVDDDQTGGEQVNPYLAIPNRLYPSSTSMVEPTIWDQLVYIDHIAFYHQIDRLLLPTNRLLKRVFDVVLTLACMVVILPLLILVSFLIKCTSRGSVFYKSARIGVASHEFAMTKFRTMRMDADDYLIEYLHAHPERKQEWYATQKLIDDPRVTPIGKILRRYSLDELPQVFDVLAGRMSLVGPRPILLNEPELYGEHFQQYCRMIPGITGPWQVKGRNSLPHEERVELVREYVQNWSLWLDIYLLAKTSKVVLTGEGAY